MDTSDNNQKFDEAVSGQLKIIEIALTQINSSIPVEGNKRIILYALGNILNALMNQKLGDTRLLCKKPSRRFMSERFFDEWKISEIFTPLSKLGVYEHRIPVNVFIERVKNMKAVEILSFISENMSCVWVTFVEDRKLTNSGLSRKVWPEGDRYDHPGVAIKVIREPQEYGKRAWKKIRAGQKNNTDLKSLPDCKDIRES